MLVLINAMAICRDPKVWDAPMEFRPERFIGSSVDVTLANLLHAFHWRLPNGVAAEELNMDEVFRMNVLRKVPLQAVAEPKLPAYLYAGP
ncbi:hypothetical protein PR202_gb19948 [Eleusine coracana subsp. coracana]|uniref:Uncharacterized protein n=1 Tax=Eleusine coracana subsp. coracana TaxID=191504 RepID=A0AAV5FA75_ELECO|nr:hypothetical protein PR202_gb19948 [Eleusine coracana subsp. coracana]